MPPIRTCNSAYVSRSWSGGFHKGSIGQGGTAPPDSVKNFTHRLFNSALLHPKRFDRKGLRIRLLPHYHQTHALAHLQASKQIVR